MSKRTLIITAIIVAVVSICSTLVVTSIVTKQFNKKETSETTADQFKTYNLKGSQQHVEGENPYNFEIKSARITRDESNQPTVVVTFSFTNTSKDNESLWTASSFNYPAVYQDGVRLEGTNNEISQTDYFSWDNMTTEVKPGVTFDVELGFILQNTTSDLEAELGIDQPKAFISRTFSMK